MDNFPPVSYHFTVDFENKSFNDDREFSVVSGIDARLVYADELADRPRGNAFGNVVLKRPLKLPSKLTESVLTVINNNKKTSLTFAISLLDSNHEVLTTWFITEAQPVRYALDEFDAMKSALAMETFEFRCRGISLTKPKRK